MLLVIDRMAPVVNIRCHSGGRSDVLQVSEVSALLRELADNIDGEAERVNAAERVFVVYQQSHDGANRLLIHDDKQQSWMGRTSDRTTKRR